jgi:hypothetical protein
VCIIVKGKDDGGFCEREGFDWIDSFRFDLESRLAEYSISVHQCSKSYSISEDTGGIGSGAECLIRAQMIAKVRYIP